jgi:hypothetical protein
MDEIPATLLLEERAALAMNAVTGLADADYGHIPYFSANLLERPAYLRHGDWDYGSSHGRLTDAAVLARHMTGRDDWAESEERYRAGLLGFLAPDGLTYRQVNPRGHWEPNANLIDQRATLLALTTSYLDSADDGLKAAADRQVAALARIAIKERDAWYYPASEHTPDGWPSRNAIDLHLAPDPASFSGRLIMPLLRYHQVTGNQDALDLCGWFARLIVTKSGVFNPDGSFNSALAYRSAHFHTRLGTLDGLARYALHTGDHALTEFVRRAYDWALGHVTSFGWTPGDLAEQRYEHECCSLVDLISTAITLAKAGHTRYWAAAERFLRNHLTESQLLDLDWVESAPDTSGDEHGWVTYARVGERVRGAFAGYGAPNDFVSDVPFGRGHTSDVQACCVGSGVRGLFLGWNNVVTGDDNFVRVNLLLSRAHRRVRVASWLPYQGRVDITMSAAARELRVRIPEWAGYAKLTVTRTVSGAATPAGAATAPMRGSDPGLWAPDGYLSVRAPRAGERITIEFPVPETTVTEMAADREFVTTWRGDDVTRISPEGTIRPMYSNRPMRDGGAGQTGAGQIPMRKDTMRAPAAEWAW